MAGTVAFAVTAVLAVAPRGIDIFGVLVLGVITAIGGGTLRDVIIDAPVFWGTDLMYIWVAVAASLAAFSATSLFAKKEVYTLMLYLDALGVALFGVQATAKVWSLGFGLPLAPVLLGVVTAIGGGLIRDVLAGRQNLLMKRELYAIPVLVGCCPRLRSSCSTCPSTHFTGEVVLRAWHLLVSRRSHPLEPVGPRLAGHQDQRAKLSSGVDRIGDPSPLVRDRAADHQAHGDGEQDAHQESSSRARR